MTDWLHTLSIIALAVAVYANFKTLDSLMKIIDAQEDKLAIMANALNRQLVREHDANHG